MSLEIKDLTGLGQPLTKLLEILQAGCGAVYEPTRIRRIAQAKAEELKLLAIANAEAEVTAAQIKVRAAGLASTGVNDALSLEERTQIRLTHVEAKRQANIESVVNIAIREMPETVNDAKPDSNWIGRFFDMAAEATDENMQDLWGRVLAGETATPGRFSLRTLEILRNLSRREAEAFGRACSLVFENNNFILEIPTVDSKGPFYAQDQAALGQFGLSWDDRMLLAEAGLIVEGLVLRIEDLTTGSLTKYNNGHWIQISRNPETESEVDSPQPTLPKRIAPPPVLSQKIKSLHVIKFTSAGQALGGLVPDNYQSHYIDLLATRFEPLGILIREVQTPN